MSRTIRMPGKSELPDGPHRRVVAELYDWYREAVRPTLQELDDAIRADQNKSGTASKETIRRMLKAEGVPQWWYTVEAVFEALCERTSYLPDAETEITPPWGGPRIRTTFRRHLNGLRKRCRVRGASRTFVSVRTARFPGTRRPVDGRFIFCRRSGSVRWSGDVLVAGARARVGAVAL